MSNHTFLYRLLASTKRSGPLLLLLYTPTLAVEYLALTERYTPSEEFTAVRLGILLLFTPIILKYVVHFLVAPWYPAIEFLRSRKHPPTHAPTVSVLIPAHNEEVGIRSTIQSVIATRYPRLEIIVINDGSTDRTDEAVTACIEEHRKTNRRPNVPIRYRRVANGGKAKALNIALSMARGDIIVTIDSDSVMDPRAIKNMVKHFADPRVASVAGNVVIGNRAKSIGLIQQLEYLYGFYFKRADSLLNAVYIVGGAAAAYRRNVIVETGGFDESIITEDIELSTRLQDRGYRVRYAADAIVYTEGPADISGLCRQRLRWKFGRLRTFYKYRHLFFSFKRRHNPYLCFLILPIALFAEALLFFEGVLLTIFYAYTFYTHDFVPLAVVILLLTGIIWLQILLDKNTRYHANLILLAPGAWLLFYFMDFIEYQALMRSISLLLKKRSPVWQKWVRVGVLRTAAHDTNISKVPASAGI